MVVTKALAHIGFRVLDDDEFFDEVKWLSSLETLGLRAIIGVRIIPKGTDILRVTFRTRAEDLILRGPGSEHDLLSVAYLQLNMMILAWLVLTLLIIFPSYRYNHSGVQRLDTVSKMLDTYTR